MARLERDIRMCYEFSDGPGVVHQFHLRHGTTAMNILTITDSTEARRILDGFGDALNGKTVVEIGSGIGFLSLEMARRAKMVYAIESDASWSWAFTKHLYATKPPNLTWIFGCAETMTGLLGIDVVVIRTRSGIREMIKVARQIAPRIILSIRDEPIIRDAHDPIFDSAATFIETETAKIIKEIGAVPI